MPYSLGISIDGGCLHNGTPDAIAASAFIVHWRGKRPTIRSSHLPTPPIASSQRAELHALIMALEFALARKQKLAHNPYFQVFIRTDSKYVTDIMNKWRGKWERNGWRTVDGEEVANRDLIVRAGELEKEIRKKGFVVVNWVPKKFNRHADWAVRKEL